MTLCFDCAEDFTRLNLAQFAKIRTTFLCHGFFSEKRFSFITLLGFLIGIVLSVGLIVISIM